jgi:chemotaxis protein methyltransferase CheR
MQDKAQRGDGVRQREFAFTDQDFNVLRNLVKEHTGIALSEQKRELVYGRLSRRLRALQIPTFREYCERLAAGDQAEMAEFRNAITTNLTSFFRESHHFDYVRDQLIGPRVANAQASRRIRIWCAACSTGEEPYSLAMTIRECVTDLDRWDIRILATDIDSDVLGRASRGVYSGDRLQGLSAERRARFLRPHAEEDGEQWQVTPELRDMVTFKHLNLMKPLPMRGPLDAIICRNVIIYFEKDTQRDLFSRLAVLQRPGDLLFLGHSESLFKVSEAYALIGKTIYRRI